MKNEISSKQILSVFEYIRTHGTKMDEGHFYEGIKAYSDFDGYNVYLEGNGVLLRAGFHNTYHLDYELEKLKDTFMQKVEYIFKLANE